MREIRTVAEAFRSAQCVSIFCGAGVTQDRTGLSWSKLNEQLVIGSKRHAKKYISSLFDDSVSSKEMMEWGEILSDFFSSSTTREEMKASVTQALVEFGSEGRTAKFNKLLAGLLYREAGWSRGRLLSNLVLLIRILAKLGISVDILTTNYDTHLEKALFEGLTRATPKDSCVSLEYSYYESDEPTSERLLSADGVGSIVNLKYLHGRIDESGKAKGQVVLSEVDYARSYDRTRQIISLALSQGPTLICGSSLVDPPLVRALIDAEIKGNKHYHKCALVRGSTSTRQELFKISPMIARAQQLGIELIPYRDHAQCAQLIIDIIAYCYKQKLESEKSFFTSAEMYDDWVRESSAWDKNKAFYVYKMLLDCRDYALIPIVNEIAQHETFKIECWLGISAAEEETTNGKRCLDTLILRANTLGPILDCQSSRRESINSNSSTKVASVQAFKSGSPFLCGLETLSAEPSGSRWQTYLSVPFSPTNSFVGFPYIGVITIASTMPPPSEVQRGFFDVGRPSQKRDLKSSSLWRIQNTQLKTLVEIVSDYGGDIARKLINNK